MTKSQSTLSMVSDGPSMSINQAGILHSATSIEAAGWASPEDTNPPTHLLSVLPAAAPYPGLTEDSAYRTIVSHHPALSSTSTQRLKEYCNAMIGSTNLRRVYTDSVCPVTETQQPTVNRRRSHDPSSRSSFHHGDKSLLKNEDRVKRQSRVNGTGCGGRHTENPYIAHERAMQIFHPSRNTIRETSWRINDTSNPAQEFATAEGDITVLSDCSEDSLARQTELRVAQTIIDWTAPSTRRHEYEEIDRANRGIRGFWRRISPRWCHSRNHLEFYSGDGSDDDRSVRRYRIDILEPAEGEKLEGSTVLVEEMTSTRTSTVVKHMSGWSCFGTKDGVHA